MRILKYSPEFICFIIMAVCSFIWSNAFITKDVQQNIIDDLIELQLVLPQHQIQLLNVNFSDQIHYDKYAQLQSQIEMLGLQISKHSSLNSLVNKYLETSSYYIQTVTMIKTSTRLISSFNTQKLGTLSEEAHLIKSSLFEFMNKPSDSFKDDLVSMLAQLETINSPALLKNEEIFNYWRLFKLHSEFILINFQKTALKRQQIIELPLLKLTLDTSQKEHNLLTKIQRDFSMGIAGTVFSLLMLLVIVLKRQQNIMRLTSLSLEHALEVKSQFLANMSHEIRTPMTGILGLVDLTLKTNLTKQQRSYLQKVDFSAKSLLTIINDILDFSKIESGQLSIENVFFEHDNLIDSLNMMLGRVAEDKNVELLFDINPNIPKLINGDPVRINQILLNLLSNAVKFTSSGHVILHANLVATDQTTNIVYQVEDSGIGLSEEQQTRMFQRFSQADATTTRKYGGTGLGLAISKLLVDLMNGKIWIDSKLNEGSKFNVSIPITHTSVAEPLVNFNGLKLLLLEDYEITQITIKKMAEYLGVDIDVASSVNDAIALTLTKQYDLALIDWNLKEESGLDFIDQINNTENQPTRLFICSAYSKEYIERYANRSFEGHYLAKPVTISSLNHILNTAHQKECTNMDQIQFASANPEVKSPFHQDKIKSETILLVEDNNINQLVATKLLQSLGFVVDLAENGEQAISMINKNQYSVVLMDVQMPVMDGIEATKVLRKQYSQAQLKIIALTANITEQEVSYYKSIGMNNHLGKPYELDKIKQLLGQYFPFLHQNRS